MLASTCAHIKLAPRFFEQLAHLLHAFLGIDDFERPSPGPSRLREGGRFGGEEVFGGLVLLGRKLAYLLADLHRAEFGAAHAAEMGGLGAFGRQRLVVVLLGRVGVERQVELVAPAEFEAGFRARQVGKEGVSTCRSRWSPYN